MDFLDNDVHHALARLEKALEKDVRKHLLQMSLSRGRRVTISVRDRDHFYKLVNWSNKNIGKGRQYWTTSGRVLRFVDPSKKAYNPPRIVDWRIFIPGVDISPLLAL